MFSQSRKEELVFKMNKMITLFILNFVIAALIYYKVVKPKLDRGDIESLHEYAWEGSEPTWGSLILIQLVLGVLVGLVLVVIYLL